MKLAALQNWLLEAIASHRTPADVAARVQPSAALAAAERLHIYSGMYVMRLLEVLQADFPAVRYTLGEARFEALMRAYLHAHPSRHPNLNQLGAHLSEFLAGRPRLRFAAALAALERAIQEVFDGPPGAPLRAEAVAAVPPEQWGRARLTLIPAARLLASPYPVNRYYQAFREQRRPRAPARAPSWTLLWRKEYRVWRQDLNRSQFALLQALGRGLALERAIAAAAAANARAVTPAALQRWFRGWAGDGLFLSLDSAAR